MGKMRVLTETDLRNLEVSSAAGDFGIPNDIDPLIAEVRMHRARFARLVEAAQIGAIDPEVASEALTARIHAGWKVGDRARWHGAEVIPFGASVDYTTAQWTPTAEDLRLRTTFDVIIAHVADGLPRLARADDGFTFDPSIDIDRLEQVIDAGSAGGPRPVATGWKPGDRAMWRGAKSPHGEERARLISGLPGNPRDFPVTVEVVDAGRPVRVRTAAGVLLDPPLEPDIIEPLIPLPTGEVASFAGAVDNTTGVSSGFYGAQNPAPQTIGRVPAGFDRRWGQSIASGRFRLHFNRAGAAPFVWSVAPLNADGSPRIEIAVSEFNVGALRSVFQPKATPDDEDGKPSAWLEVDGTLSIDERGVARIEVGPC